MSADDRIEMDEDMAEFWAEVKDRLPGFLGRDGFVSAYPVADPGDVDIFTSWWNQKEEHIASLYHYPRVPTGAEKKEKWEYEPCFNLLVDEPGTDGRTLTDVTPKQVAKVIEKRAADQVREHLPGAWSPGTVFEWDGTVVASFEDPANPRPRNFGEFVEYVCGQANEILVRKTSLDLFDHLLFEGVVFSAAAGGGRVLIEAPGGMIRVTAHGGEAGVELNGEHPHGPIRVTPAEHGITYSYTAMNDLLYAAKENR